MSYCSRLYPLLPPKKIKEGTVFDHLFVKVQGTSPGTEDPKGRLVWRQRPAALRLPLPLLFLQILQNTQKRPATCPGFLTGGGCSAANAAALGC